MTIEHRLHHAARELREVPIDIPTLGRPAPRSHPRSNAQRSRLPVLAAPLLFMAGSLLAVGGMQRQVPEPAHSDIPLVSAVVDADRAPIERTQITVPAPSVREELQLIAEILDDPPASPEPASDASDPGVTVLTGAGPS